jgi:cobyric acid synthase
VIDLPHISNFTDFDAFRVEPDVRLRVIRSAAELNQPDAVILPGSKNTLADLDYLRRSGLAERIGRLAGPAGAVGPVVVGICAGLQMLGTTISDPEGIESAAQRSEGLGLLPARTVLAAEKTVFRTAARHAPSGLEVAGYEIHHGRTWAEEASPILTRPDGEVVGLAAADERIWGTYLHGVFDSDSFRRWFIDSLRIRRGWPPVGKVIGGYDIEPALYRLADAVRRSLQMDEIYRLLKL